MSYKLYKHLYNTNFMGIRDKILAEQKSNKRKRNDTRNNTKSNRKYMHWRLADKAMKMHTLEGKELNIHVKVMTLMSSRIADYKKYINLITFLQK